MPRRLLTLSLFALAAFAVGTAAQPPAAEKKKAETKLDAPKPAADLAIEAALANDPDVRMARAKIQLAEAEFAKARQAVTMKVLTLRAMIGEQRKAVVTAEEGFNLLRVGHERAQVSRAELLAGRDKLETAQAALARSETELKLLTGDGAAALGLPAAACPSGAVAGMNTANCALCHNPVPGLGADQATARRIHAFQTLMAQARAAGGPIPDRIRAALDKPIALGAKDQEVSFPHALEEFKKVGLDVPVHHKMVNVRPIVSLGGELPVGAWLQMFADHTPGTLLLVREYGLLVTVKDGNVPADAMSVFDLWKQKPAAKDEPKKK